MIRLSKGSSKALSTGESPSGRLATITAPELPIWVTPRFFAEASYRPPDASAVAARVMRYLYGWYRAVRAGILCETEGSVRPSGYTGYTQRGRGMEITRKVVVFDAADLAAESVFWAGMLNGSVFMDETWHTVVDAEGRWVMGIQLAPNHVPPEWPDGPPQQVHLDLHVNDPVSAHADAIALGARLLKPADDLTAAEGHQVYADPAGHPFCIGWGHPDDETIRRIVRARDSTP